MSVPWLSVVMPTYNGAAYLSQALESIRLQHDNQIEVIAVDDGSTDATLSILEAYANQLALQTVRRERAGNWVVNTNHGLKLARGEYVSILHQDDLWLPERLAVLKRRLTRQAEVTWVLHPSWFIDPRGRRLGQWHCPLPAHERGLSASLVVERLLVQNFIAMPAPLFRRDQALKVGGLDEQLWYTADWDFWLKLAAEGLTLIEPRALTAFRLHPHSQTWTRSVQSEAFHHQLEVVLDRHLPVWEQLHPGQSEVRRVASFAIEVNTQLAARLHGQRANWLRLAKQGLALGPSGWYRFLRDSRVVDRVGARLRLAMGNLSPLGRSRAADRECLPGKP